jgi:hypothetical protein
LLGQDIDVPAGTSSVNLPLAPGLPPVTVALSNDTLQRDNEVTLVEPRPRIVSVENRLAEGRGRDALERALRAVSGITRSQKGELVFGPAGFFDQPAESGVWRVGFGRAPSPLIGQGNPQDLIGPFVPEKRHPLLQGVTLGGVVWAGALPVGPSAVRPLVSSGNTTLIGMLGQRPDDGILFNLDLDKTNLVRTPDWPILISNLVELRRQDLPGPDRWNYRAGEMITIHLGRDAKERLHYRCGSVQRDLPSSRILEFVAPAPCGLLDVLEGSDVLFQLGVNFLDENESNLSNRASGEIGKANPKPGGARTETGPESDPLFWTLLAITGLAVLANWCWAEPVRSRA